MSLQKKKDWAGKSGSVSLDVKFGIRLLFETLIGNQSGLGTPTCYDVSYNSRVEDNQHSD